MSLIQEPKRTSTCLAGFRYLGLGREIRRQLTVNVTGTGPQGNSVNFGRSSARRRKTTIWAGIVGARGRVNFGDSNWFANGYVDVGGGSSAFTWQGVAGVGYAFDWGDVILDYRYLYYSQVTTRPIDDMKMGGLALGANFRF